MKKLIYLFLFTSMIMTSAFAGYKTPGTGQHYILSDLVTISGGVVTFDGTAYNVNDTLTISQNDSLLILTNATVKFAAGIYLSVRGTIIVDPPTGVLFTAQNTAAAYNGMRIDTSNTSSLKKLTFEYAIGLKISDCSPTIDNCIFQYNNNSASTTFSTSAVSLFRSSAVFTNCQFLNNNRAAISGGANIANAPKIYNCLFMGNDKTHYNTPQINLGTSGTDTTKIINCQILRADTNSGGIGFLPIGDVYAVITGNTIKNNRYGITFNGGQNIHAYVAYNTIDSNNTQGSPTLGGSGISLSGGSASSIGQNTIITGNLIRWNLWGITIQNRSRPVIGNLTNADTSDNGKNQIYGNLNNGATPRIDLYNNTVDSVYAQNNYWGFDNIDSVEAHIYHFPDLSSLGLVIYNPAVLPVELTSFTANAVKNGIMLNWKTATELNNYGFEIQRKETSVWNKIGFVKGVTFSNSEREYSFVDRNVTSGKVQYRLKQIDMDGSYTYSDIVNLNNIAPVDFSLEQNYPNPFNPSTSISYTLPTEGYVKLSVYNAIGQIVKELAAVKQTAGKYQVNFNGSNLGSGVYFYNIQVNSSKGVTLYNSTRKMILIK